VLVALAPEERRSDQCPGDHEHERSGQHGASGQPGQPDGDQQDHTECQSKVAADQPGFDEVAAPTQLLRRLDQGWLVSGTSSQLTSVEPAPTD
jgi:hypothetical protein